LFWVLFSSKYDNLKFFLVAILLKAW
jgi:hypothetical protein